VLLRGRPRLSLMFVRGGRGERLDSAKARYHQPPGLGRHQLGAPATSGSKQSRVKHALHMSNCLADGALRFP
jgi:hypothetical protein